MTSMAIKTLGKFIKPGIFDRGTGALLPEAYKKFYKEWKLTEPTAVHYIPEEGKFKRDEVTGEVRPVQNYPIPVIYPKESNEQMWGGEGIVQGFQIRDWRRRRVPHFWMPHLKRSVVYSEVLDKYISVVVTDRTISLINANYGFDHYLLKTPACDLKSILPLTLKRKILQELEKGCPIYQNKPDKQKEVYNKYKQYLSAFTSEEIEWYGYSFAAACKKLEASIEAQNKPIPLKHVYRSQLIEKLKEAGIREATEDVAVGGASTWLKKINPFAKET
ncbi:39S ribosomal protein L28, mitochondrial [Tribolium madens]|uniref:39S ribosomal protein L28, mitochondrial n=1 Tax=Tribolium madens TaxID=41895 RepID=UPI001CF723DB|nr:39S ribosomal protein L28, mitochondrial [Tribolium madens]